MIFSSKKCNIRLKKMYFCHKTIAFMSRKSIKNGNTEIDIELSKQSRKSSSKEIFEGLNSVVS